MNDQLATEEIKKLDLLLSYIALQSKSAETPFVERVDTFYGSKRATFIGAFTLLIQTILMVGASYIYFRAYLYQPVLTKVDIVPLPLNGTLWPRFIVAHRSPRQAANFSIGVVLRDQSGFPYEVVSTRVWEPLTSFVVSTPYPIIFGHELELRIMELGNSTMRSAFRYVDIDFDIGMLSIMSSSMRRYLNYDSIAYMSLTYDMLEEVDGTQYWHMAATSEIAASSPSDSSLFMSLTAPNITHVTKYYGESSVFDPISKVTGVAKFPSLFITILIAFYTGLSTLILLLPKSKFGWYYYNFDTAACPRLDAVFCFACRTRWLCRLLFCWRRQSDEKLVQSGLNAQIAPQDTAVDSLPKVEVSAVESVSSGGSWFFKQLCYPFLWPLWKLGRIILSCFCRCRCKCCRQCLNTMEEFYINAENDRAGWSEAIQSVARQSNGSERTSNSSKTALMISEISSMRMMDPIQLSEKLHNLQKLSDKDGDIKEGPNSRGVETRRIELEIMRNLNKEAAKEALRGEQDEEYDKCKERCKERCKEVINCICCCCCRCDECGECGACLIENIPQQTRQEFKIAYEGCCSFCKGITNCCTRCFETKATRASVDATSTSREKISLVEMDSNLSTEDTVDVKK
jgi:hypothetical protein